ncbi:protein translocase subunit SecD, partial [bacterium]|nr:protein translocase subunit SecD [bacterium]
MKNIKIKFIITLVILAVSLYFLIPTLRLALMSPEAMEANPEKVASLRKRAIKLGLDLQGGMHIIMEIDKDKIEGELEEDPTDEALEIIRNRIDQFGVSEPVIQKEGTDRIIVELPGIDNPDLARELIQETALLEFKLLSQPGDLQKFAFNMDTFLVAHPEILGMEIDETSLEPMDIESQGEEKTESDSDIIVGKTKDIFAEAEKTEQDSTQSVEDKKPTTTEDIFEGESTGLDIPYDIDEEEEVITTKPFTGLIDYWEDGSMFMVSKDSEADVKRILKHADISKLVPKGCELHWGSRTQTLRTGVEFRFLYLLNDKAELTGKYLEDASFALGSSADMQAANQPVVNLKFNKAGAKVFSQVTGANIKKRLAIVLDDKVHTAPVIQVKIRDGNARITGIPVLDEAKAIAIVLRAGALPAPLKVIEERTIGPTLGEDSIRKGVFATLLGFILVVIFIIIYYKGAGLVANVALLLNLIILMAAMAGLHATLTLPGI